MLSRAPSLLLPPIDSIKSNVDPEAIVPVARLSARPVPFTVTSRTVSVPKLVPLMSVPAAPVSPTVNPCNPLPVPRVMAIVPTVVIIGSVALPVAGKRFVPDGAVNPVIVNIDWLAPCPIIFSLH